MHAGCGLDGFRRSRVEGTPGFSLAEGGWEHVPIFPERRMHVYTQHVLPLNINSLSLADGNLQVSSIH